MQMDQPAGDTAASPSGTDLRFEAIGHDFESQHGSVQALAGIDFAVNAGQFVAILGPSGCGKSTLLLLAAGLLAPSEGAVVVGGERVTKPFTDCGFVFQDASLLEWRTALRNILLQAEARGMDRGQAEGRARELMELTGISGFEDAYPTQLSGGMRQRVALCRALLHDPPVLFMDEPFGALDALTREQMVLDTQRIWMEGAKTVLFVTHDIGEAIVLADRVVVLGPRPGRILEIYDIALPRPRDMDALAEPRSIALQHKIRELLRAHGVFTQPGQFGSCPGNEGTSGL
ncbi:MAG: ATP-binding cassette domain-containing protein [Actinobacteria bacterium]|nr:ATP-binding cassette domain-containing protein [Actinomycetota bacterium]